MSKSHRSGVLRSLLWGTAFILTTSVSATVGGMLALTVPLPSAIAPQTKAQQFSLGDLWKQGLRYQITRPVNILVMGVDRVLDAPAGSEEVLSGRSDTMLLVRVDPTIHSVSVLSIPRDTQVNIPRVGLTKINHANALGGAKLAAQAVAYNLNGVTVDRYVRISTDAFRELVDMLGGVNVFVPHEMYYVDETQKLEIDLQQGWQTLNGDQAEQFARYRNDSYGDIGRVQRQQQLIRALREKVTDPSILPKLPQAIQLIQKYIDTNLSLEEMLSLVSFGLDLDQDDFRMIMLPGRFSAPDEYAASYWLMDSEDVSRVMYDYFHVGSIASLARQGNPNNLRIAVQNASGEPQLGQQVALYLQNQGFDNVYIVQDWPDHQQQTQIIVQGGNLQGAAAVENILGMGQVVPASTGDLDSDLTIRVGEDWVDQPQI